MQDGSQVPSDLVPSALTGMNLAHYRLLLPLHHEEDDAYRPWSAFLPSGAGVIEPLRNIDLYGLRHCAADAGRDMTGWDSSRGSVSEGFVQNLREALGEFIPAHATWTLSRWRGYRHELADARPVTFGGLDYAQQVLNPDGMAASIGDLGMPDFMFDSTRKFGWGAPLFPDWGIMTMATSDYIRHFTPRGFESFSVPANVALPDNLGD